MCSVFGGFVAAANIFQIPCLAPFPPAILYQSHGSTLGLAQKMGLPGL
jgi:hypothetical protein